MREGASNLRSGVIFYFIFFFLLLCFFGSRGKKSKVVSSRERHKGIIGRGHDLRLGSERQTTAETEQSSF